MRQGTQAPRLPEVLQEGPLCILAIRALTEGSHPEDRLSGPEGKLLMWRKRG